MKSIARLFGVIVVLFSVAGCQAGGFAIRPYLQNPSQTEITVMWTTADQAKVELRYGEGDALDRSAGECPFKKAEFKVLPSGDAGKPLGVPRSECVYEVRLTGLKAGTTYGYQVTAGGEQASGTFRTFPAPAKAEPFMFGAYGDTRTDHKAHKAVAEAMAANNPAFILHTGDMVQSGPYPEWEPHFFGPLANVINHIPLWPAQGNHEGDGVAYRQLFSLPNGERLYSFDYSNVHFVSLDSMAGTKGMPEMLAWLGKDLAASKADWKIVFYHLPTYDLGSHHTTWGRTDVAPLFRKHGVDLVISGHSHSYQRFNPMVTAGENDRHPITYMVAAGGGAPLGPVEKSPFVACSLKQFNYVLISVDGEKLTTKAMAPDGKPIDTFEIVKKNGKLDPAYVAAALPEQEFDTLRNLIFPSLRGIYLAELPQPGKPVTFTVNVGAGDRAMKFTLRMESGGHYVMTPAQGSSPANGTTPVTVTLAAKGKTEVLTGGVLKPAARLVCDYEINGKKGSVLGGVIRFGQRPTTTEPDRD